MYHIDKKLVETRRRFLKYYETELKSIYARLEPERKQYLKKFVYRFVLFLVLIMLWGWAMWEPSKTVLQNYLSEGLLQFYIFYFAIMYACCRQPFEDYKEQTKLLAMRKILAFWGKFRYDVVLLRKDIVCASGLFPAFDDIYRDDEFEITQDDIKIVVSEQHITKTVRTSKGSREVTKFRGLLLLLDFNKKFVGKTLVEEKGIRFFRSLDIWGVILLIFLLGLSCLSLFLSMVMVNISKQVGMFSLYGAGMIFFNFFPFLLVSLCFGILWYTKYRSGQKKLQMEKVCLEDVVFAKKWNVTATDQVESRYILSPALMERMLEVKKRFYGKKIDFSFFNNKCLIAVHTHKDIFETTSLFTKTLSYHKVNEVVSQIYAVCSVAELVNRQGGIR